jgi:hypothetical protein
LVSTTRYSCGLAKEKKKIRPVDMSANYTSTILVSGAKVFIVWVCLQGRKRDTVPKRWQIQYVWILGVQEFVLFVLGDVLCLLPKFSLRPWVYSAHLDPQCARVCPVRFG